MITWIFGNTESGKTTLAKEITRSFYNKNGNTDFSEDEIENSPYTDAIWLDGNDMREIWTDLGLSKKDRWEQNLRVARLAKILDGQGFNVVVSVICPYKKLRKEVKKITNCKFIYIEGGKEGKEYPFDKPIIY